MTYHKTMKRSPILCFIYILVYISILVLCCFLMEVTSVKNHLNLVRIELTECWKNLIGWFKFGCECSRLMAAVCWYWKYVYVWSLVLSQLNEVFFSVVCLVDITHKSLWQGRQPIRAASQGGCRHGNGTQLAKVTVGGGRKWSASTV